LILKKLGANINLTILHYFAVGTGTSFIGVFVGSRDNIAPECSRDAATGIVGAAKGTVASASIHFQGVAGWFDALNSRNFARRQGEA
jgi:hypothetical protein